MPADKAKQAEVATRRAQAVQLRLAGATLDEIGKALKYDGRTPESIRANVSKDLTRALAKARGEVTAAAAELIEVELQRLDRVQRGLWTAATQGDTKAVGAFLGIHDRRVRLLGLIEENIRLRGELVAEVQVTPDVAALITAAKQRQAAQLAQLQQQEGGGS